MFKIVIETQDQCHDMFKVNNKENSYISISIKKVQTTRFSVFRR